MPAPAPAPLSPVAPLAPAGAIAVHCQLSVVDRHVASAALSCLTGWIVAEAGHEVVALGLRLPDGRVVRCNYPFYRGDAPESRLLVGAEALTGFNLLLPESIAFMAPSLTLVALIAADDREPRPFAFTIDRQTGKTHKLFLAEPQQLSATPEFITLDPAEVSALLEARLFNHLARQRHITLRLDLINKCNLRCVMCHYSNDLFFKRPAQRIAPEQFLAFFDPIAPVTRDVVLSCGDEPLMSPHFETIIRDLAERDPAVRIRFCTNGMLMNEKISAAIIAARVYMVMFSFDGVQSDTLHRIRVGSDFPRIIKHILQLKRLRMQSGQVNPRFVFNYVMLESNIQEAPLFVQVAKRLGGRYIDFRHVVPVPSFYDIEHEMLEYHKPKYNYYRERIVAAAEAAGIEIYIPPPFDTAARHDPSGDPKASLDEFHATLQSLGEDPLVDTERIPPVDVALGQANHESEHYFCDRPFSEAMIHDQKDVYPCPWHREKMGTLDGHTTLEEIFFGENFRRVRLAMLDPQGAPGCKHCPIKANYLPTRLL